MHEALRPTLDGTTDELAATMRTLCTGDGPATIRDLGQQLGRRDGDGPLRALTVRQAYHDLRGGSLTGLVVQLELVRDGLLPASEGGARAFLLARDHLKMMRNAVRDLDPERFEADLVTKAHAVRLLRDKWSGVTYGPVRVRFTTDHQGAVAERCMEFAALDRVLYNLVNNAARFASSGVVDISLRHVDGQLQFVVANEVDEAQQATLRDRFGSDLSQLFHGGFTTGGHGLGLRIVADFVSHGYGLRKLKQTLDEGYCGARLEGPVFLAWFHWPAA